MQNIQFMGNECVHVSGVGVNAVNIRKREYTAIADIKLINNGIAKEIKNFEFPYDILQIILNEGKKNK